MYICVHIYIYIHMCHVLYTSTYYIPYTGYSAVGDPMPGAPAALEPWLCALRADGCTSSSCTWARSSLRGVPKEPILYYISIILYYTILYYTILYYTILYYTILYYTILYYTILYYTILYYTILYYTILYYTILYYTILYYTILYLTWLIGPMKKPAGLEDTKTISYHYHHFCVGLYHKALIWMFPKTGAPQNRSQYTTLLLIGAPKKGHQIFGNPHGAYKKMSLEIKGTGYAYTFSSGPDSCSTLGDQPPEGVGSRKIDSKCLLRSLQDRSPNR